MPKIEFYKFLEVAITNSYKYSSLKNKIPAISYQLLEIFSSVFAISLVIGATVSSASLSFGL